MFFLDYTDHKGVCGYEANVTMDIQFLVFPGYPDVYPANIECNWTLTAPEGEQVLLEMFDGTTETSFDLFTVG